MKLIIFNLTTLLLGLLVGSSFASNCEGAFATIARPSKPVSNKTNLRSSVGPGNLASRKLIRDREEDKKAAKAQHMKTSRIIGGNTVTDPDAYHYFAQWDVGCGATMIAPDMLLSAASCSNDTFARTVWIGGHDYQIGVRRTIVKRQKHPSYVSGSFDYDFVVLKLNEPITEITWPILADISPVELAQEGEEKEAGEEVTLIGFGPTTAGGYGSKTLQEATVELLPNEACEGTANALCVNDDGKSACMSDVGGPVLDATSGKQIGIVSG